MPRLDPMRDERGMALALALFALIVIGAMVAANFLPALLEQQSGRNLRLTAEAAAAAEGALWEAVSSVPVASLLSLPVGGMVPAPGAPWPGLRIVGQVTRLSDNLFLVESRAVRQDAAGGPLATSAVGLLAQLATSSSTGTQSLVPIGQRPWLQLY